LELVQAIVWNCDGNGLHSVCGCDDTLSLAYLLFQLD
jgi:hypothetical protein